MLALTDPLGDTAGAMRQAGIDSIAPLNDKLAIAVALKAFLAQVEQGCAPLPTLGAVKAASRAARSIQLAALFDSLS